jgi:uncharacterized membrane protein
MTIDKQLTYVIMLVILSLGVLTAVPPILPDRVVEPFTELGILGPNLKLGDYPESVEIGESFTLYLYLGNHESRVMYYRTLVKFGDELSFASETEPMDAPVIASYDHVVLNENNVTRQMSLSAEITGTNRRLVFELYKYDEDAGDFVYSGEWVQLWMNVTSPV